MFPKTTLKIDFPILGLVFLTFLCTGFSGANAYGEECTYPEGCEIFGCPDDSLFTMDFRLEDCQFKTTGSNPFFILMPGYQLVLETPEGLEDREKSVETVLCDTKRIDLDGRRIKTRVVEERAYEWDGEKEEWVAIEISLNYFAICKKTNAVYYFGEDSRDCDI